MMSAPTTAVTRGDLPMLVVAPVILMSLVVAPVILTSVILTYLPISLYSRLFSELGSPVVARDPPE